MTISLEDLKSASKSRMERIPISKVVNLVYSPALGCSQGAYCEGLVVSSEYTEQEEGKLVYVHQGSQHGILNLLTIENKPMSGFPQSNQDGIYDRDKTRRITAIHLPAMKVIPLAYFGTLKDLLKNPNIKRA